ncbi:uncharacterized protein LOC111861600 [Cryptotermes secundus]|uniref:uncharacterized protein LOC111861600 n=1 Tax=Cryptotermes secundus TaxID=105785 RepID=UPI001454CF77|nr:uncharacterized protein LOC111861600 [Cryptotermes secundus]
MRARARSAIYVKCGRRVAAVAMTAACVRPGLTDFISRISEGDDSEEMTVAMLEDKLIPHTQHHIRSFRRRSSEYHSRRVTTPVSPSVPRRRSSSIAVARQAPLMVEHQRPWGHISPRSVSPRGGRQTASLGGSSGYRARTASMPAVPRNRPMLGQLRRCEEMDYQQEEYYRVRSFSITPNGIFNLGDSFKSRRSRSINSVSSTGSSHSDVSLPPRERLPRYTSLGVTRQVIVAAVPYICTREMFRWNFNPNTGYPGRFP